MNPALSRQATVLVVALVVAYQGGAGHAAQPPASEPEASGRPDTEVLPTINSRRGGQSPDDIVRKLERLEQPRESKVEETALDSALRHWESVSNEFKAATGLAVGVAYTTLYQRLTDKKDGDKVPIDGAVGDLDIYGDWTLPGGDRNWLVGSQAEMRHRIFTSAPPSELGKSAGSLWGTTSGFSTQDISLVELWWQQAWFDESLRYRIGEVDQANFFDVGTLSSANLFFSNAILSDNPAIAFPGNGLGAAVSYTHRDDWYLSIGIGDANGRKTKLDFNSFFEDKDYFTAVEVGWTPNIEGYGQGFYQITGWDTDGRKTNTRSEQSSGRGIALRLEQFLGEEFMFFGTYSRSSGGAKSVRQLATAGIGMLDILGYKDDIIGVAVSWGQPEDRSLRDQYVAELFYRMQITDFFQVTPDIQVIVDPARNRDNQAIAVFGLRLRLDF